MNALILAHRFLRWRTVGTFLGILSVSLAVGLVATMRTLPGALAKGAVEPAVRLPFIVGRGESASRLVLAVIFLEPPAPGPMPRTVLDALAKETAVWDAIPIDVDQGAKHLLVRTNRSYFHRAQERVALSAGRYFDDQETDVAVVGSAVAGGDRLGIGDRLGLDRDGSRRKVVGILAATGTMLDSAVFAPFGTGGSSVSAVALVPKPGFDPGLVRARLGNLDVAVIDVEATVHQLVRLVAAIGDIVNWLSAAVAALAVALVLATFYSSMRERVRDLAVLRVIGARRGTLLLVLVFEAGFIGLVGGALGLLMGRVLLAVGTDALAAAGYAFSARIGADGLRVVAGGLLITILAGATVARGVYRMDPVTGLAGVHRPWFDLIDPAARRRHRRSLLVFFAFAVMFLPSTMYRPSPPTRPLSDESFRMFALLRQWDGQGQPPPEVAHLDGQIVELEGYRYQAPGSATTGGGWQSSFSLVGEDYNMPVELLHDDSHRPMRNERIEVELEQPVEPGLYPLKVRGTFRVSRDGSASALYRLVKAHARVIALGVD